MVCKKDHLEIVLECSGFFEGKLCRNPALVLVLTWSFLTHLNWLLFAIFRWYNNAILWNTFFHKISHNKVNDFSQNCASLFHSHDGEFKKWLNSWMLSSCRHKKSYFPKSATITWQMRIVYSFDLFDNNPHRFKHSLSIYFFHF